MSSTFYQKQVIRSKVKVTEVMAAAGYCIVLVNRLTIKWIFWEHRMNPRHENSRHDFIESVQGVIDNVALLTRPSIDMSEIPIPQK